MNFSIVKFGVESLDDFNRKLFEKSIAQYFRQIFQVVEESIHFSVLLLSKTLLSRRFNEMK